MHVIICGLRRSGTTLFWRMFRQDAQFTAYDEPFNPSLERLPSEHPKQVRAEFIRLLEKNPSEFRAAFSPISYEQELQTGMTESQASFLRFLASNSHGPIAIDTTRCHMKARSLASTLPDAVLIHLFREPHALVSSHLLPSAGVAGSTARNKLLELRFWSNRVGYNSWGFQTITSLPEFEARLHDLGIGSAQLRSLPSAGRLLAYWKLTFETVESEGRSAFKDRFISVPFERFTETPHRVLECIYEMLGRRMPTLDLTQIRPASPAYRSTDPRWNSLASQVGIGQLTGYQVRR